MGIKVRVKNKKTGIERTVEYKAYKLFPHIYTPLAFVDENGNEVPEPTGNSVVKTVKKNVPAPPVVNNVKRGPGRPAMTEEQKAAKRAELEAMNQAAIEKVRKESQEKQDNK